MKKIMLILSLSTSFMILANEDINLRDKSKTCELFKNSNDQVIIANMTYKYNREDSTLDKEDFFELNVRPIANGLLRSDSKINADSLTIEENLAKKTSNASYGINPCLATLNPILWLTSCSPISKSQHARYNYSYNINYEKTFYSPFTEKEQNIINKLKMICQE